jgi:NAD(P)-dependent dehydrogenase (short-subunit alcohol dehydrogenase family)
MVAEQLHRLGPICEETIEVSDESDVARLFDVAQEQLGGRIDVLFQVAGISGRAQGDAPLHECELAGWDRVLAVNALGTFLCNRAAVRIMLNQTANADGRRGCVINLGSVLDQSPAPRHFGTIAYAASKGAVRALTLSAAAKYARQGIRFNLIEPALVATPMAARAVDDKTLTYYNMTKQPLTMGPLVAEDVAHAAVYLASHEARALTGAVLRVDGGWCVSEGEDSP